ncbi:TIGR04104 family putative zinc finger protein [Psychrobacillus sp. PGGUH221]|uniref:TIGR04104 family putative zinc finger protein n=1 Tax=Psychrobacillus sp. PGGUH221 TaxID=3020058 RepID=UPI0035C69087
MQKCNKCKLPFKWSKIYNSVMWFYKPIQCEKCGADYKIYFPSRLIGAFFVLPIPIFGLILSPFDNELINILTGICISFTGSLLITFLVKYKNVNT